MLSFMGCWFVDGGPDGCSRLAHGLATWNPRSIDSGDVEPSFVLTRRLMLPWGLVPAWLRLFPELKIRPPSFRPPGIVNGHLSFHTVFIAACGTPLLAMPSINPHIVSCAAGTPHSSWSASCLLGVAIRAGCESGIGCVNSLSALLGESWQACLSSIPRRQPCIANAHSG